MQKSIIIILKCYQILISPFLRPSCRFYPSCSQYAISAVMAHGVWRGCFLAVLRVSKCHPWNHGGFDPVPEPFSTIKKDCCENT